MIESAQPTVAAATLPALPQRLSALLDEATAHIEAGASVEAFRLLGAPLSALWAEARGSAREDEAMALAHAHRLHLLVQQDPYTHRASSKPRGYAGDAVMLDHVYRGTPPEGTTLLGQQMFAATTRSPMGLSVRYRRVLLRSLIDDVVASTPQGRVLSVASGHCRELEGSLVETPVFDGEFVALDQDPLSCEEVARVQAGRRVRVVTQGVRDLLARGGPGENDAELGRFDLIYSAGLYDYLPETLARRLTARLLQMLRPGGRLLIANFVPTGSGRGYMELFMEWPLIVRNEAAMLALCAAAGAQGEVASFHDPHRNVVYALMTERDVARSSADD
jgi:extracellular factor (EF) 3-hydroxypalmitic acid methyl ester biosynthesis protein